MKHCSKCGVEHDRQNQRYCRTCHAANMRGWRKTHPPSEEQRRKDIARSYAGVYKRRGKLDPEPCTVCGKPAQMHHFDYNKPLEVVWVCPEHHHWLHRFIEPVPAPDPSPIPRRRNRL